MRSTNLATRGALALLGTLGLLAACSTSATEAPQTSVDDSSPDASAGGAVGTPGSVAATGTGSASTSGDASAALPDASADSALSDAGDDARPDASSDAGPSAARDAGPDAADAGADAGVFDKQETDVGCGGPVSPPCTAGQKCLVDRDCDVACGYALRCVSAPSCKPHLGGDTCGTGEVGEAGAQHESCCRTLPVPGYADPANPGKAVYLDKYEITAGRVRAWIDQLAAANGGVPDVKGWIAAHPPRIWVPAWNVFLPTDYEGGSLLIGRRLLGDPRPEDAGNVGPPGPGVILPPATDQVKNMGVNYQFGTEVYVDLHGSDCGTWNGSYGFPTFYYPPNILARDNELPRASGLGAGGVPIPPQEFLDVKAMNCISNAMLAAFCAWDGGQLATDEVLDYVTATPASLGNTSGCGTQYDDHGWLLSNSFTGTVQTGGRCPAVALINATFDAGDALPVAGSALNAHHYHFPDLGNSTSDKAWEISAPGRASTAAAANGAQVDQLRVNAGDEPWVDLAGNATEAALDMTGPTFTGKFALKYRGIGYGTSRSDLNMTLIKGETILRVQRPEAKAAYAGGRCMRWK